MKHITLINPNTSRATTAMMTEIASKYLPEGWTIEGVTAPSGVPMILNEEELAASAQGTIAMGLAASTHSAGLIVSAFGDPGLEVLKVKSGLPVVGICEASMLEAATGGRRFGIATVTPELVSSFTAKAEALNLSHLFTGTRLTPGDPFGLARDPQCLHDALDIAVRQSIELDGAEAVIIGGGPLGQAAVTLQTELSIPVIAPIRAAVSLLVSQLGQHFDLEQPSGLSLPAGPARGIF